MSSIQDRLNAMRNGSAAVQPGYNDGTVILYLRDLYDQQTAADQEALKSIYGQNVADVKASGGSSAASTSPQTLSIQDRLAKMRTSGQSSAKKTVPITTDLSGEAWTRATPSQTKVPASTATLESIQSKSGAERAISTVSGGVKGSAAGYTNLAGTAIQSLGKFNARIRNYQNQGDIDSANQAISRYQEMLKTASTAAERDRLETLIRANQAKLRAMGVQTESEENISRKSAENLYQKADALKESSERDIAEAKQGLGGVGQFAVDLGVAGTQLAGDIALSTLTGGSSLIAMGARSAGSAAQEARQSGASFGQQVAYGIGSGALSVATEKLSNVAAPFKKAFGSGVLDKAIEKTAGKLMQNAAGKALVSAAGEGFEEIAEDAIQPILQRITYDKDALAQYKDPDYLANTLYDGLIGAAMGGIGGTVEAAGNRVRGSRQNSTLRAAGTPSIETEGNFTSSPQNGSQAVSESREQEVQIVPVQGQNALDWILFGGKRVDQSSLTQEQFDAAVQANEQGTVGMDAAGKVYQVDPEQHIDRRTADSVGSRNMNAFQFDHPELHGYYQRAAGALIADAELSQQFPMVRRYERTMQGNKTIQGAQASEHLRMAMDETGLSRAELIDAAQRIINDQGQENVKAAKQVEVILDSMLTNGWTTMTGETVAPNEAYIRDKSRIAGSQTQVESREPLPIWDMEEPANDGLGNDGVGARTSQFPRKERVSHAKSVYQQSDNAADADKAYDATSDAERLTSARERLQVDYDGEKQYLQDTPEWSGEDYAVAKLIQSDLRKQAVESGDFTEFRAWSRDVQKHASFFGQDLQSLKMWVEQSADKAVSDAAGVLAAAKEAEDAAPLKAKKKITDDVINDALGAIAEFGTRAEALSNAEDMAGLYDLAVELANYRGYRPSKIIRNALKSCTQEQLTDVVWSEISGISIDAIPSSAGQYISTYQYLSHLLNAKTILRNITSNTVFSPVESLFTNNIAAIVDRLSASVVGKYQGITAQQARTVGFEKGPFSKAGWKGGLEGAKQSAIDVALDISRGNSQNKYEAGTNRTFNRHKVKDPMLNLMLNTGNNLEGILGYGLNTTDEFQKGGTEAKVRESMRGILGTEGTRVTPEMADQFVENEQLYRSFQRETFVGEKLQSVKNLLNVAGFGTDNGKTAQFGKHRFAVKDFGLGDFIVSKYTRVPGALVTTLAEYTDLGYAKAIYNLSAMAYTNAQVRKGRGGAQVAGNFGAYSSMTNAEAAVYSQRAFAQNIGRVLTGKGLMMACSALAKMGVLIFTDDDDKDEATIKNVQGLSGLQINLSGLERLLDGKDAALQDGDILLSADSLEPVNGLMEGGARMAELEDDAGYGQKMNVIAETVIDSFMDLSMMQNVKSVQNAFTYKSDDETWGDVAKEAAYGVAKNNITGFIPGPIRQAANWSDPYYRDTSGDSPLETIGNSMKSAVPGLRQQLPERITPLGEKREKTTSGWLDFFTSFISPFNVTRYQQSDVVDAMEETGVYAARSAPKTVTADGKSVELNAEQQRQYQAERGTQIIVTVSAMLGSTQYKRAGDAQKQDLMADAMEYANYVAKANIMGKSSVPQWVQKTMDAQRSIGIPTSAVIVYRDMLSREKDKNQTTDEANSAVREAIRNDTTMTAAQKTALDDIVISDGMYISKDLKVDYTNNETFIISQMSDGAQKRYSGIKNQFGLDAETYSKAWSIYQNDDLKADQKRQQLSALGYNGSALYKALGQKLG